MKTSNIAFVYLLSSWTLQDVASQLANTPLQRVRDNTAVTSVNSNFSNNNPNSKSPNNYARAGTARMLKKSPRNKTSTARRNLQASMSMQEMASISMDFMETTTPEVEFGRVVEPDTLSLSMPIMMEAIDTPELPSAGPTAGPSSKPSTSPSVKPTSSPSAKPSASPSAKPTASSGTPTLGPVTGSPTTTKAGKESEASPQDDEALAGIIEMMESSNTESTASPAPGAKSPKQPKEDGKIRPHSATLDILSEGEKRGSNDELMGDIVTELTQTSFLDAANEGSDATDGNGRAASKTGKSRRMTIQRVDKKPRRKTRRQRRARLEEAEGSMSMNNANLTPAGFEWSENSMPMTEAEAIADPFWLETGTSPTEKIAEAATSATEATTTTTTTKASKNPVANVAVASDSITQNTVDETISFMATANSGGNPNSSPSIPSPTSKASKRM